MIHEMKLFEKPFENIQSGIKTIEVRLYDEKRKTIRVGDKIRFSKLPDNEQSITVRVIGLSIFSNFKTLFTHFDSKCFGHHDATLDPRLHNISKIYSPEQERMHGVVGIRIELV